MRVTNLGEMFLFSTHSKSKNARCYPVMPRAFINSAQVESLEKQLGAQRCYFSNFSQCTIIVQQNCASLSFDAS